MRASALDFGRLCDYLEAVLVLSYWSAVSGMLSPVSAYFLVALLLWFC